MKKKQTLFQFKKKLISSWLKIIDQISCSQFAVRYLSVLLLVTYLNTSKKTIFFIHNNQVLFREIRASNNFTHEIHKASDCSHSLEVRGVFLDISKAFDKVWHDGLLYNLKRNDINCDLLKLIKKVFYQKGTRESYQAPKWNKIKAGFPQGSIFGLLFSPIYINNLPSKLCCSPKLFADNTSLF